MDIPTLGFGTYQLENTYSHVLNALKLGYRHIDTATLYKNEDQVGRAVRDSGIDRKLIFITTKISLRDIKKNDINKAIEYSLKELDIEYIDLVLLHAPCKSKDVTAYQELCCNPKIIKYGVSNYNKTQLQSISHLPLPYVNQIEVTPFCRKLDTVAYCVERGIKIVAHSSLYCRDQTLIKTMANKYKITPESILLSWATQHNFCIIPKTSNIEHMIDNMTQVILADNDFNVLNNVDQVICKYNRFN